MVAWNMLRKPHCGTLDYREEVLLNITHLLSAANFRLSHFPIHQPGATCTKVIVSYNQRNYL